MQKPFVNTLLCALDRIIDEAAIQTAGRELPQEKAGYSFYTTGKVKAVELLADRQNNNTYLLFWVVGTMKFYRLASGFATKSGSLLPTKTGARIPDTNSFPDER